MPCKCDREYYDKTCDVHGDTQKKVQKINKKIPKKDVSRDNI